MQKKVLHMIFNIFRNVWGSIQLFFECKYISDDKFEINVQKVSNEKCFKNF